MARDMEKRRRGRAEAQRKLRQQGKPRALTAVRSVDEVTEILNAFGHKISSTRVEQLEQRAMIKLREALADLACDFAPELQQAYLNS